MRVLAQAGGHLGAGCVALGLLVQLAQLQAHGLRVKRAFALVQPVAQAQHLGQLVAAKAVGLQPLFVAAQADQNAQQPQTDDGLQAFVGQCCGGGHGAFAGHGIS